MLCSANPPNTPVGAVSAVRRCYQNIVYVTHSRQSSRNDSTLPACYLAFQQIPQMLRGLALTLRQVLVAHKADRRPYRPAGDIDQVLGIANGLHQVRRGFGDISNSQSTHALKCLLG